MKLSLKMRKLRWAVVVAGCALSTAIGAAPAHSANFPATWGGNNSGQLGNGITDYRKAPVVVDASGVLAGKTVTAISTGTLHSLALTSNGRVYAWGSNLEGRLGDGTATTHTHRVPIAVDTSGVLAGKTITAISAGYAHSLALSSDGRVYAWGSNYNGRLGTGTAPSSKVPVGVDTSGVLAGKTITAISAGADHSLALSSTGRVYAWGLNAYGELGDGTITHRTVPVAVDTSGVLAGKIVTAISAGYQHSLALASKLVCPTITLAPAKLPNATVGDSYRRLVTANGGAAPYGFRVVAGDLPPGLTLSRGGALSGTPTTAGSFTFAVRATDANGCQSRVIYTLQICSLITVSPGVLAMGQVGISYGETLTASGGTAPYTFKIISGALASGLTLTSGGTLSGTPTVSGDFTFTVRATDAGGCRGARVYTLHINP